MEWNSYTRNSEASGLFSQSAQKRSGFYPPIRCGNFALGELMEIGEHLKREL